MATTDSPRGSRTYGNWRRPASPGLLGLGSVGTGLLLGGIVAVVVTVMVAGLLQAFGVTLGLGLGLIAMLVKDGHDRNLLSRLVVRGGWLIARSRGSHLYRSGPLGRARWGTFQLPGIAAPSRLTEHTDSHGRRFALLYIPATGHYSVVVGTEPDGADLVDEEQVDLRVAEWGHWLARLGGEPGVDAASVTIETVPDSGSRLRREVRTNLDPEAPALARRVLEEVSGSYPVGSFTVRAFVTLSLRASPRPGGRRRTPQEMGRDMAARLPVLTQGLQATGAGAARPLSAQELCETIRTAYDPAASRLIDEVRAMGGVLDLSWPDVGPAAAEAGWGGYRHDDGYSITWSMTAAPRGAVQSRVLAQLLAPHHGIDRKRVTLLYRPVDAARAAGIVEADLRAAQFRATASRTTPAREALATRAAAATATEEASGAGLVNFGLLVTATVLDGHGAGDARAAVAGLAATARLRLRPVYGSQDSAFAACLPLGLVLPRHLRVPAELRDRL